MTDDSHDELDPAAIADNVDQHVVELTDGLTE